VELSAARKWAITVSVMLVTVMQVLDTSVTNVALPHMQGSLSASVDDVAWVLTSYLAANAVIIPATGWLSALLGRKRFFLIRFCRGSRQASSSWWPCGSSRASAAGR
jgi:DHA2 family multidrug resistance protein